MMTREEWDERYPNGHPQGFPPWAICTLGERIQIALLQTTLAAVVFPAMVVGMLWIVGSIGEGVSQYNVEHDRCLKHATDGYEIKQCR